MEVAQGFLFFFCKSQWLYLRSTAACLSKKRAKVELFHIRTVGSAHEFVDLTAKIKRKKLRQCARNDKFDFGLILSFILTLFQTP